MQTDHLRLAAKPVKKPGTAAYLRIPGTWDDNVIADCPADRNCGVSVGVAPPATTAAKYLTSRACPRCDPLLGQQHQAVPVRRHV